MSLRAKINESLKEAMKSRDKERLSTLRLMNAAIKDMDISLRGEGKEEGASEADVLQILSKMVKQRQESAKTYEEGGRLDLAEGELKEITVIEDFLPRKLSDDEITAAIDAVVAEVDASSIRDMGKVMGGLKAKYTGQMDFGQVGGMVKARLNQ
ncbi:MAG: GatB/YqeY domain-containing protein [Pseudomonadota bacterium]|nr:GatB/YqeY domain-containing protein [Pseudomonadota bacterium]